MFHIASQSVTLRHPKAPADAERATSLLVFGGVEGHDTSKCILELGDPDGNKIRLVFNRGGQLISQDWIERPEGDDDDHPVLTGNYMVDGRDTRADDPYTHVAPAMHGDPIVPYAGGLQPDTFDADGKPAITPEMRTQALEEAAKRAKEAPDEKDHDDYPMAGAPPEDDHAPQDHGDVFGAHQTPSPGPSPFETTPQPVNPPLRNPMMTDHGKVNTTESIRNG